MYLDGIVVFGDDPNCVWAEIVTVIRQLTEAGFILNVKKSVFFVMRDKIAWLLSGWWSHKTKLC